MRTRAARLLSHHLRHTLVVERLPLSHATATSFTSTAGLASPSSLAVASDARWFSISFSQRHAFSASASGRGSGTDERPGNSDSNDDSLKAPAKATPKPSSFLERIIQPSAETGESTLLRILGYYTTESKAIGVANSLYAQILSRSSSTVQAEFPSGATPTLTSTSTSSSTSTAAQTASQNDELMTASHFLPQYEMMALHVYMTLRRLRQESGSAYEADVKIAMQTLFDKFWTDVRYRMMMKEQQLSLLQSGKWIKVCEKNFFSMALAFDEALDAKSAAKDEAEKKMRACISKHVTSLRKDPKKVSRFLMYMRRERRRLDKIPIEQLWQGVSNCWEAKYAPGL